MTTKSDSRPEIGDRTRRVAENTLSGAAVLAAFGAVFAWSACCVLPLSLALAGLGLGGLSWVAGQRVWLTLAALGVIVAGWIVTWRRSRPRRGDCADRAPSRLAIGLLSAATLLVLLALAWRPVIEPWALALIRSARA